MKPLALILSTIASQHHKLTLHASFAEKLRGTIKFSSTQEQQREEIILSERER